MLLAHFWHLLIPRWLQVSSVSNCKYEDITILKWLSGVSCVRMFDVVIAVCRVPKISKGISCYGNRTNKIRQGPESKDDL